MQRLKYHQSADKTFFKAVRKEVFDCLPKKYRSKAKRLALVKAIGLLLVFIGGLMALNIQTVTSGTYLMLTAVMGITCLPMVLNIGHEAVHHNFSTNTAINKAAKNVFFLLGTSAYFWELRHNSSHHAYANVKDVDLDIEQTNIIRLSKHQKHLPRHRLQHLYMPFAFCFYTLQWFFVRDFTDLKKKQFGAKTIKGHPRVEVLKLFGAKIWHLLALLFIPYFVHQDLGLVLGGFFVFHITASAVTTFALISTHVGEVQEIVTPNKGGKLPYTWAEHQLMTTADFSPNSWVALHFFAGFNHHVAHHLFPHIPHIYYPMITPIIKKHAAIHGINYHCYPNLIACAKSHFRRLKHLSNEI